MVTNIKGMRRTLLMGESYNNVFSYLYISCSCIVRTIHHLFTLISSLGTSFFLKMNYYISFLCSFLHCIAHFTMCLRLLKCSEPPSIDEDDHLNC